MCDGSGYLIGCPGCGACREEMDDIRDLQRQAADALQGLALSGPRVTPGDPWEVAK